MVGKDVAAECAQALRDSSFEYEQLLGTSVERVWLGVGRAVERSLLAKRGLSVPGLGRFGFYKETPHALVFLLADRFLQSHSGASWRNKPPPAPLSVLSELNTAVLGSEVGLARDQAQQSLDELLRFIGRRLSSGRGSGRLAVGSVGGFVFEGRSISFGFDAVFVKRIAELQGRKGPVVAQVQSTADRRCPTQKDGSRSSGRSTKQALQRFTSVGERLDGAANCSVDPGVALSCLSRDGISHTRSAVEIGSCASKLEGSKDGLVKSSISADDGGTSSTSKSMKKKKRHHHKHSHERSSNRPSSANPGANKDHTNDCGPVPRILPRFLISEPSVPTKPSHSRVNHELVMKAAFEREKARLAEAKQENDRYRLDFERRQRATQLETLQQRAEKIVGQRSLNAFLNYQIGEKGERRRQQSKSLESAVDPRTVTILPPDRSLSTDVKREQKQKLNKRLNEQVAAKAALKRDHRVVDQAEMAYFISQLEAQALEETEIKLARKLSSKRELQEDWAQQRQFRAVQKELQPRC